MAKSKLLLVLLATLCIAATAISVSAGSLNPASMTYPSMELEELAEALFPPVIINEMDYNRVELLCTVPYVELSGWAIVQNGMVIKDLSDSEMWAGDRLTLYWDEIPATGAIILFDPLGNEVDRFLYNPSPLMPAWMSSQRTPDACSRINDRPATWGWRNSVR